MPDKNAGFHWDNQALCFHCIGLWDTYHIHTVLEEIKTLKLPKKATIKISAAKLKNFDSAGALVLVDFIEALEKAHNILELIDFTNEQKKFLDLIIEKKPESLLHVKASKSPGFLYSLGKKAVEKIKQADGLIILIGSFSDSLFKLMFNWKRLPWRSVVSNIERTGIYALPIIGLLSFLIGVVLAYQMGLQLETYGANIFIAYLSGMAIFREFGPLITAIIVAGRTSSAFTAEIGSMKINEEIDALDTMGLSSTVLLVIPKVLGLLIIFPLLIFWADFFGTLGAMLMSRWMLNVGSYDFLTRLQDSVGLEQLMLGLYKAPAFAILIGLVGCFQGFQVESSADSLGAQTTKSVVQALFLIIVADAFYSVIYSWLDL